MVALRSAGGPFGRGSFRLTWQGATIARQIDAAVLQAMTDKAREIKDALHAELHRYPEHQEHQMADEAFAEVSVRGTKRTLALGSEAPYTAYHEQGTSTFEGHPQIRQIADRYAPTITPAIRAALGRGR